MEPTEKRSINDEINHILLAMRSMNPGSKEYKESAEALKVLFEARSKKDASKIDREVIFTAALSILEILIMLNYEHGHVISSKVLSRIRRV